MATPTHTHRTASHNHNLPSRPTTPLRPVSRTSLRASTTTPTSSHTPSSFPLETLEPAFAELSDSLADLEANMLHLQILHESIARFNENFASFLYGLNMSAFCVDFPEAPGAESFKRAKEGGGSGYAGMSASPGRGLGQGYGMGQPQPQAQGPGPGHVVTGGGLGRDVDATFLYVYPAFDEDGLLTTRLELRIPVLLKIRLDRPDRQANSQRLLRQAPGCQQREGARRGVGVYRVQEAVREAVQGGPVRRLELQA